MIAGTAMAKSQKLKAQSQSKSAKSKPAEVNWRVWYLGGVLFFISIPLGLYLWNPFTAVQRVRKKVDALEGRATLEVAAPGVLQAVLGSDISFWSMFAGGTKIRQIQFNEAKIQDDDLKILRSTPFLMTLSLLSTPITDAGLDYASGLTHLKELDLTGTGVTQKKLEELLPRFKELELLNLNGLQVTEEILTPLKSLPKLKSVSLSSTPLSPEALEKIRKELPAVNVVPQSLPAATPSPPVVAPVTTDK